MYILDWFDQKICNLIINFKNWNFIMCKQNDHRVVTKKIQVGKVSHIIKNVVVIKSTATKTGLNA